MDWADPGRTPAARALLAGALALAVAVVFLPSVGHDLVSWDDPIYVSDNPLVRDGLTPAAVRGAFRPYEANFIPLTWLSLALDTTVGGGAAWAYHATNVALHAANAALLFLVLRAATGATGPAWFAALLWALHPLRVESVAWVSERKDVLSGLLGIASIGAWIGWTRRPSAGRRTLALGLFALALLAKPMLVSLPLVLLLLDRWPLGRLPAGRPAPGELAARLAEKAPLFGLALAAGVATLFAQRAGGAVLAAEAVRPRARLANALLAAAWYPAKTLWPSGLSFFYPLEPVSPATAAACAVALAVATGAVVAALRSRPWLAVGWCWYLVMLLPVLGIVQVGEQARADRYTYLPAIGLGIAAAWLVDDLARGAAARRTAAVAAAVAALALAAATRGQLASWRDSTSLYRRALEVDPLNYKAHALLAQTRRDAGDTAAAIAGYEAAMHLRPSWGFPRLSYGNLLLDAGRPADALPLLERAAGAPDATLAARNSLARCLLELGRPAEAEAVARRAIAEEPRSRADVARKVAPLLRRSLCGALAAQGRLPEAIDACREAVALDPASAAAQFDLGLVLGQGGDGPGALAALREAARRRPGWPEARFSLAVELHAAGDGPGALREVDEALRLRPGWPRAAGFREGLLTGRFPAPGELPD